MRVSATTTTFKNLQNFLVSLQQKQVQTNSLVTIPKKQHSSTCSTYTNLRGKRWPMPVLCISLCFSVCYYTFREIHRSSNIMTNTPKPTWIVLIRLLLIRHMFSEQLSFNKQYRIAAFSHIIFDDVISSRNHRLSFVQKQFTLWTSGYYQLVVIVLLLVLVEL